MKKTIILSVLAIVSFLTAGVWTNITPFPDSQSAIRGNFVSAEEGWIYQLSMESREIFHTEDGGENWESTYSIEDTSKRIAAFHMADSLHGWITVNKENHYPQKDSVYDKRTTDGGYSWEDMTQYIPEVSYYRKFYFINKDLGFFSGLSRSGADSSGIYKTSDGGYTWNKKVILSNADTVSFETSYSLNKFYFLDETHGWAACTWGVPGAGTCLYTSNGGETWQNVIDYFVSELYDVHFINPLNGGAVGRNSHISSAVITDDNFENHTYYTQAWGLEMGQYAEVICFQNDSTVWITGSRGRIYRSLNKGITFEEFQVFDSGFTQMQFFGNTGYIYGQQNTLLKYDDTEGIESDEENIAYSFHLSNYPNPFNPITTINYELRTTDLVNLAVLNTNGEKIWETGARKQETGKHSIKFDGSGFNSGIYFCSLFVGGNVVQTRKMVLVK